MIKKFIYLFLLSLLVSFPKSAFAGEIGIDVGGQYQPLTVQQYDASGKPTSKTSDIFSLLNINWIRTVLTVKPVDNTGFNPKNYGLTGTNVLAVYQDNCGNPNDEQVFIDKIKNNQAIQAVQVGNEQNKEPDPPKIGDDFFNCTPEGYVQQVIHFYDGLKDSNKTIVSGGLYISDDYLQNMFNVDPTNRQAGYQTSKNFKIYNFVINYFTRFYTELRRLGRTDILSDEQALRIGLNFYINEGQKNGGPPYNRDRLNAFINAIKNLQGYQNSKFWVTEYGWRSAPDYLDSFSDDQIQQEIQKQKNYSPKNQADYDKDATAFFQGRPEIEKAFLFSLHDVRQARVSDGQLEWRNLGLIDHRTGLLKPVFYEIKNLTNPGSPNSCNDTTIKSPDVCISSAENCAWRTCSGKSACVDATSTEDCALVEAREAEQTKQTEINNAIAAAKTKANQNTTLKSILGENPSFCLFLETKYCLAAEECIQMAIGSKPVCLPKAGTVSEDTLRLHGLYIGYPDKFDQLISVSDNKCQKDSACKSSVIAECTSKILEDPAIVPKECVTDHFAGINTQRKKEQAKIRIEETCNNKPQSVPDYNPQVCLGYNQANNCYDEDIYLDAFNECVLSSRQEAINKAREEAASSAAATGGSGAAPPPPPAAPPPAAPPAPPAPPPAAGPVTLTASDFCSPTDEICWQTFEMCKSDADKNKCMSDYQYSLLSNAAPVAPVAAPATPPPAAPPAPATPPPPPAAAPAAAAPCDRDCQIKQKTDYYCTNVTNTCGGKSCRTYLGTQTCTGYGDDVDTCMKDTKDKFLVCSEEDQNIPRNIKQQLDEGEVKFDEYVGQYCEFVWKAHHPDEGLDDNNGRRCEQTVVQRGCQNLKVDAFQDLESCVKTAAERLFTAPAIVAPIDQLRNVWTDQVSIDSIIGAWCGEAGKTGVKEKDCDNLAENTCAPLVLKETTNRSITFAECIQKRYNLGKFAQAPVGAEPTAPATEQPAPTPIPASIKKTAQVKAYINGLQEMEVPISAGTVNIGGKMFTENEDEACQNASIKLELYQIQESSPKLIALPYADFANCHSYVLDFKNLKLIPGEYELWVSHQDTDQYQTLAKAKLTLLSDIQFVQTPVIGSVLWCATKVGQTDTTTVSYPDVKGTLPAEYNRVNIYVNDSLRFTAEANTNLSSRLDDLDPNGEYLIQEEFYSEGTNPRPAFKCTAVSWKNGRKVKNNQNYSFHIVPFVTPVNNPSDDKTVELVDVVINARNQNNTSSQIPVDKSVNGNPVEVITSNSGEILYYDVQTGAFEISDKFRSTTGWDRVTLPRESLELSLDSLLITVSIEPFPDNNGDVPVNQPIKFIYTDGQSLQNPKFLVTSPHGEETISANIDQSLCKGGCTYYAEYKPLDPGSYTVTFTADNLETNIQPHPINFNLPAPAPAPDEPEVTSSAVLECPGETTGDIMNSGEDIWLSIPEDQTSMTCSLIRTFEDGSADSISVIYTLGEEQTPAPSVEAIGI
ncbi:hypothetical protein HYW41_03065 [Candidatus Daviesbacteria bacterium]|nr:hypothetical protein [Candidatus Daviesbacteria bacterium]